MSPLLPAHRCLRLVHSIPRRSSSQMHRNSLSMVPSRKPCTLMFQLTAGSSGPTRSSRSLVRGISRRRCSSPFMMPISLFREAKRQIKANRWPKGLKALLLKRGKLLKLLSPRSRRGERLNQSESSLSLPLQVSRRVRVRIRTTLQEATHLQGATHHPDHLPLICKSIPLHFPLLLKQFLLPFPP